MLETQVWPESWREHWVVTIYKKEAVFAASNYRGGIHFTAQLSKVVERLLLPLSFTSVAQLLRDQTSLRTPNVEEHEMHWPTSRCHDSLRLTAARKSRSTVRMFQVRSTEFELSVYLRLRCKGVHSTMVALTESWVQQRTAHVVVEGQFSDKIDGLEEHCFLGYRAWLVL